MAITYTKQVKKQTFEEDTLNDMDKICDDTDIKTEVLGIQIEIPNINTTYLKEGGQSNVSFEAHHSDCINPTMTFSCNNEKINVWNNEFTHSSGLYSECIKQEEIDPLELTCEKKVLYDNVDKTDDIDIKIEYINIKIEEPHVISAYDNEHGEDTRENLRVKSSSSYIQNLHDGGKFIKNISDMPMLVSKNTHQKNTDSESMTEGYSLKGEGCTNKPSCINVPHVSHKHLLDYESHMSDGKLKTSNELVTVECTRNRKKTELCNNGFTQLVSLANLSHTEKNLYKCDICYRRYTKSSSLIKHKLTHTGDNKPFKCDVCNKGFKSSSHLATHKLTHTGERPYKCDVCNKRFSKSSNLSTHKLTHTGEKPYTCDVCNKGFTQSGNLAQHKLTHLGTKAHKCDVCNKGFTLFCQLTTHKLTHTGIRKKPYVCDLCNKTFITPSHLVSHKLTHTGEKPFKCDVCDARFTHSGNLGPHRLTHTGEKPYKCDVCNKGFTRSSHLETHKFVHTSERPYQCDVCNKGFKTSSDRTRHKYTHTGDKPYKCDLCNEGFTRPGNLVTHKLVHTKETS